MAFQARTLTSSIGTVVPIAEMTSFSFMDSNLIENPYLVVQRNDQTGHLIERNEMRELNEVVEFLFRSNVKASDKLLINFFLGKPDQVSPLRQGRVDIRFQPRNAKIERFINASGCFFPAGVWRPEHLKKDPFPDISQGILSCGASVKVEYWYGPSVSFITEHAGTKEASNQIVEEAISALWRCFQQCSVNVLEERIVEWNRPILARRDSEEAKNSQEPTQPLSLSPPPM